MSLSGTEVDKGFDGQRYRPEESSGIGINSGVDVVNLGSEVYEVILTSIEVKSDQGKGTTMDGPIETNIRAAHEAHVGIEEKLLAGSISIYGSSGSLNVGHAHLAFEVTYRRGIEPRAEGI